MGIATKIFRESADIIERLGDQNMVMTDVETSVKYNFITRHEMSAMFETIVIDMEMLQTLTVCLRRSK